MLGARPPRLFVPQGPGPLRAHAGLGPGRRPRVACWPPPRREAFGLSANALQRRRSQARSHWHSSALQRFFTQKTHKKFCPACGKPGALLLDACNFCGEELTDEHIGPTGRDALVDTLLSGVPLRGKGERGFRELHRSFEAVVLAHAFPAGRLHLLALPKGTLYDLRQLRRRQLPLLHELRHRGLACLKQELGLPEAAPAPAAVCGFSYPADYNQLHLHLVAPPFSRLDLFERRVFYPFEEVVAELDRRGVVKPHPVADEAAEDAMARRLAAMDAKARQRLEVESAGTPAGNGASVGPPGKKNMTR